MKKSLLIFLLLASTNAISNEVPFKVVTKCINGHEWLFTYTTEKESRYVTLLDAEQVFKQHIAKSCSYKGTKNVK